MHSFRSFLQHLDEEGQVDRITVEVDPIYELAGVASLIEAQQRTYWFEQVQDARFPHVGGIFNQFEHIGTALGYAGTEPFTHQCLEDAMERAKSHPIAPETVATGPVKDVTIQSPDVNLGDLPVPSFFELDSGPFITAAVGVTRDPATGRLNVGVYRTLILERNRMVVNASSMSDLRRIYERWEEAGAPMPIALAIGVSAALLLAAAGKPAPGQCEFDVAGGFLQVPIELVKCEDSDLMVPADAEFVIEGTVDFSTRLENNLGEFAGQYGPESAPVTTVNTITHRQSPIYHSIMAGRSPEHNNIGGVAGFGIMRSITAALKSAIPEIKNIHAYIDPGLGTLAHVVISIDKQANEQPGKIIEQAFAASSDMFPISMIVKRIVVVDEDIDVEDKAEVEWAIWTRVADAKKYCVIPDVRTAEFERAAKPGMKSVRIGIDATMDLEDADKLVRPIIPGVSALRIEDYIAR